jgi:adenylate cyclase
LSLEIELKLLLAATDIRRFMAHPCLRAATERSDQMLDNYYYDTPELALRRRGVALRLRKQGRLRLQTIKLAAQAIVSKGLAIRAEWETPFRQTFDFSMVEDDAVRAWLQQPEIAGRIGPLFRTRFRRVTWHLPLAEGGEILVALDRGEVTGNNGVTPICEVELELAGSSDIPALQTLAAELGQRVMLAPSDVSKAQRGYALLDQPDPRFC